MRTLRTALLCSVLFAPTLADAAPLTVVDVAAPAINCVFNPTCTVVVTDTPRLSAARLRLSRRHDFGEG
jgi:hypothetical protein